MAAIVDGAGRAAKFEDDFGGQGARSILAGDRYAELERRMSYYECTQHDRKFWDFDGRPINPRTMQPLLGAERAWWVPIDRRRPSTPVRLGKVIVNSFSHLLFGENRFPSIRVEGDASTEDWLQAAAKAGKLPAAMILARGYGGSAGSVGVSWCFRDGKPQFEAHKPQNLFVHSWESRLALVPEHVSEVYLFHKTKWDGKGMNKVWYWHRRDWTPDADVVFKDVPFDKDSDPVFVVDWERTVVHDDGVCHLEWIQNLPSDEMDGEPDYHGIYEKFDRIDTMMSVIVRGGIRNLDPTVKLKMDRDEIDRMGLRKGSDNALAVGKDGDAEYMELGGQSIEAGLKLVEAMRRQILEEAACIVPDPHEVAAQGVSSVAIKAMFAPMTAKADQHREQYGTAGERILDRSSRAVRAKVSSPVVAVISASPSPETALEDPVPALPSAAPANPVDPSAALEPVDLSTREVPAQLVVTLPPKMVDEPLVDPLTGKPSGEKRKVARERVLGPGGEVSLQWPPYFQPTPQDQQLVVSSLQVATGGKAVLSAETATEIAARAYGVDPSEEWARVQAQSEADAAAQGAMFDSAAAGGQVSAPHEAPPGAAPSKHDDPVPPHPDPVPPHPGLDPDAHVPVDLDLTRK